MSSIARQLQRQYELLALALMFAALSVFTLVMCLLNAPVFAVIPVAVLAAAVLAACRQRGRIRQLRTVVPDAAVGFRRAFIRPEIDLPPGFVLPSVRLTPPASNPPLTSLPPTARESRSAGLAVAGILAGGGFMSGLDACAHPDAVPVDLLVTGERVAWWCEGCGTQLPAAGPRGACRCRKYVTPCPAHA